MKTIELLDGNKIPALGMGTWELSGQECRDAISHALKVGYRHFDTASMYRNEDEIGAVLVETEIPRKEIFITSKVWRSDLGRSNTKKSFADSLADLKADYIDLYLIHWPGSNDQLRLDSYQAMMELRDEGKIKSIGVSNFTPGQIADINDEFGEYPVVNQIKFNPFYFKQQAFEYAKAHDIVITAYTPLNKGNGLDHPNIMRLAEKYNKSRFQIVLRWFIDLGLVTIPKSATPKHIEANFDIFDFQLTADEVNSLKNL